MLPVKAFLRFLLRLLSGSLATFDCIRGKEWGVGRNKQRGERKRKRMEWGKTRCGEWPYSFAGRDSYWLYRQSLSPLFLLRSGTAARENFENYRDGVISKDKKIHILGKIEFFVLPNKVRGKVLIEEHLGISNMQLMQIMRCYYYYFFFPFP